MKIVTLLTAMACYGAAFFQQQPAPKPAPAKPTPYEITKQHIIQLRQRLQNQHVTDTALLQRYFVSAVVDSIIPYWYGTAWDFNGTTQVPGKGMIACGYFVTTVLRDAGIKINRVKMGQSSSEEVTRALAEKKDIKVFYDKPLPTVLEYIKSKGFGLYIIGLDCHVGFILNDSKGVWFIHSKWFGEKAVVKEAAAASNILYYSKYRMLGKISCSKGLLTDWVGFSN